jgi:outer membrane receptor protein involved in Fe transport
LLDLALNQGFGFLPLRGERDEQKEVGLTIPIKGWAFDFTHYHTNATNFFDHDVLGNSNIFLPLTIAAARLRGWEATVQSPLIFDRVHVHLAYARQWAQGQGAVTGGLTDFSPPPDGLFYLDHDQRDTLSAGFDVQLPWHAWTSGNVAYGSGFLNGDGPEHMSGHTSVDFSFGKSLGEGLTLRVDALNIADSRYLLDNSNTFGGTHYNYPRQISLTLRYRIHY